MSVFATATKPVNSNTPLPAWQQKGADAFAATGLPHTKLERWKYTPLNTRLAAKSLLPSAPANTGPVQWLPTDEARLDVHDGVVIAQSEHWPQGVSIENITHSQWPQFAAWLHEGGFTPAQTMLALNAQHASHGILLRVAPKAVISTPITIVHTTSAHATAHPRLIVQMGEGAQCTIIEHYQAQGDALLNQGVDVWVADRAICRHYRTLCAAAKATQTITSNISVGKAATYDGFTLTTGSGWSRAETHARLTGDHTECSVNGVYLLRGQQLADTTILMEHQQPHCRSNQNFKGLLAGEAQGVFQGKIFVHQAAQKTDGYQLNNTMLLSDKASMNTKPELEIYADDVKCSHGATTGQMDDAPLFYMRARGIDEATARRLLLQAFLAPAFDSMGCAQTREEFMDIANQWLAEVV